jgi:predicted Zn-dependent protease
VEDDPKRLLPLHLAYDSAIETAAADPEAAIAQLRKIIEQRPDFAAAIDALGALLIARDRPKEAVTLLAEARAGGLRHRVLAERLAAALLALKDARGALAILEPLVESDAAAADARFLLARAYAATGNTAGAIKQLRSALDIDPTFAAASDFLARLLKNR